MLVAKRDVLGVVRGDDRRSWGILAGRSRRRIDINRRWEDGHAWRAADESLGMSGVGGQARAVTDREDRGRAAVVHVGRREIAEAAVMMGVVVPREQILADPARVVERRESVRKLRPVLERPELRFRKRIVIAHARTESARLAERLIAATCAKQGIGPHQLTMHTDRGAPMRSKLVAELFADLSIDGSFSRAEDRPPSNLVQDGVCRTLTA